MASPILKHRISLIKLIDYHHTIQRAIITPPQLTYRPPSINNYLCEHGGGSLTSSLRHARSWLSHAHSWLSHARHQQLVIIIVVIIINYWLHV